MIKKLVAAWHWVFGKPYKPSPWIYPNEGVRTRVSRIRSRVRKVYWGARVRRDVSDEVDYQMGGLGRSENNWWPAKEESFDYINDRDGRRW